MVSVTSSWNKTIVTACHQTKEQQVLSWNMPARVEAQVLIGIYSRHRGYHSAQTSSLPLKNWRVPGPLYITAGVMGSWLACWSWELYHRDVDRVGKEDMVVRWAWSELLGEPYGLGMILMLTNAGCRVHLFSSGNLGSVPKDAGQIQLYALEKGLLWYPGCDLS